MRLYVVDIEDPDSERLLHEGTPELYPLGWTPESSRLLVGRMGSVESYDVLVLSVDEPESPLIPVLTSDAGEWNAVLSSDGRWVAYVSDSTGHPEVYVRYLDGSEPPWQVSTDGGVDPCFAVDGSGRTQLIWSPENPGRFRKMFQEIFDNWSRRLQGMRSRLQQLFDSRKLTHAGFTTLLSWIPTPSGPSDLPEPGEGSNG